jgi:hypothetical protein
MIDQKQRTHGPEPAQIPLLNNGDEAAIDVGSSNARRTELGRLLVAARREYLAAEGHFLDRRELARELRERRGGASTDIDE